MATTDVYILVYFWTLYLPNLPKLVSASHLIWPYPKNPFVCPKEGMTPLHSYYFRMGLEPLILFDMGGVWILRVALQGINISHIGKRKIIFKMPFLRDMLVPWRVRYEYRTLGWSSKHGGNAAFGTDLLFSSLLDENTKLWSVKTPSIPNATSKEIDHKDKPYLPWLKPLGVFWKHSLGVLVHRFFVSHIFCYTNFLFGFT